MFLGIEIGGTKLQIGVGLGNGILGGLWRGDVDPDQGAEGIIRQIVEAIPPLLTQTHVRFGKLKGIGIGFGGPIDDALGRVIKSHHVSGWDDFPLVDWMEQQFELPVVVGNDADVACLAEVLFGMGQKLPAVFYITVGSGIGGGLIVHNEIYRGGGRGACEIGHLPVMANGDGRLVVEQVASGWAIAEYARERAEADKDRAAVLLGLAGAAPLTPEHVGQAAFQDDPLAQEILDRSWSGLADGINQVVTLMAPSRIIIGGGVSLLGEQLFFKPLREKVARHVFPPFAGAFDIVPAGLGEEVVVHGALAMARKRAG